MTLLRLLDPDGEASMDEAAEAGLVPVFLACSCCSERCDSFTYDFDDQSRGQG